MVWGETKDAGKVGANGVVIAGFFLPHRQLFRALVLLGVALASSWYYGASFSGARDYFISAPGTVRVTVQLIAFTSFFGCSMWVLKENYISKLNLQKMLFVV